MQGLKYWDRCWYRPIINSINIGNSRQIKIDNIGHVLKIILDIGNVEPCYKIYRLPKNFI